MAIKAKRLHHRPHVPSLQEDNARTGFFELDQLAALLRHLPDYVRGPVVFASITGWRKQEVLGLEWSRINFRDGTVRLDPAQSKNRKGRVFPFTPELRHLLEQQRRVTNDLQQELGRITPFVFHRKGERLRSFTKSWARACAAAGVPGRLFHDLRRSAVRAMEQSGVPRSVAMDLIGHRTESIYRRYTITDERMLKEGVAKLAAVQGHAPREVG